MKEGKGVALTLIFLPAAVNIAASWGIAVWKIASLRAAGVPPQQWGAEIVAAIYTYSFYWSVVEAVFAGYAAWRLGSGWLRERYSLEGLGVSKALLYAVALAAASLAILWGEQFLASLAAGGWAAYMGEWHRITARIPLWSKLYMVAVAPFAAGFFEEILWRGYAVDALEPYMGRGKALLLEAVAFGLWHGPTWHAVFTAVIGYIYGLAYVRLGRRLAPLTAGHVLTDVVGFYTAFFL